MALGGGGKEGRGAFKPPSSRGVVWTEMDGGWREEVGDQRGGLGWVPPQVCSHTGLITSSRAAPAFVLGGAIYLDPARIWVSCWPLSPQGQSTSVTPVSPKSVQPGPHHPPGAQAALPLLRSLAPVPQASGDPSLPAPPSFPFLLPRIPQVPAPKCKSDLFTLQFKTL